MPHKDENPMSSLLTRIGDGLLAKVLASECKKAGVTRVTTHLPFGKIESLQRANASGATGEAIVLLHGVTADNTAWLKFAKVFRSPLRVLIPDLAGHGHSVVDLALDYGIAAQSERLKLWLTRQGVTRAHLIGNSMGGAIALHLAASNPQLVASMVLIDAGGVACTPSWLQQQFARTGVSPMIEINSAGDYRAMMHIGMAAPPYIPGIIVSALARAVVRRHAINQKIVQDVVRDLDQTASLTRISAPVQIIWGAEDRVLHVDNAAFLHQQLRNSRVLVMPDIGHMPMIEAPKAVAEACMGFLADFSMARSA